METKSLLCKAGREEDWALYYVAEKIKDPCGS